MAKWILILTVVLFLPYGSSQENYRLRWRMKKGLRNIYQQTMKMERIRYNMSPDMKKRQDEIYNVGAETNAVMHWKAEKSLGKGRIIVVVRFKSGKLKLVENGTTFSINTKNPKQRQQLKESRFRAYRTALQDGFAFLLDRKTKKIHVTWLLEDKEDGGYTKKVMRGPKDPLGLENSYRQLPGKEVPVGYKWELKYNRGLFVYENQYTFEKITTYKGRSVAKIKVAGKISYRNEQVGEVNGLFYHDYKRGIMLYQQLKQAKNVKFVVGQGKERRAFEELFTSEFVSRLRKTNA